jgi:hypothetical protein
VKPAEAPGAGDKDGKDKKAAAGGTGGSGPGGDKKGGEGKEEGKKAGAAKRKPKPALPMPQGEFSTMSGGCGWDGMHCTVLGNVIRPGMWDVLWHETW